MTMDLEDQMNAIAKQHGFTLRYLRAPGNLQSDEVRAFAMTCMRFRDELGIGRNQMAELLGCSPKKISVALKG
jgi:hypothetical protein